MTEPRRLFKCTTAGYGTFYVVARDETTARKTVEKQWETWGYTPNKGRVVKIDVLAEEGQYPEVPAGDSLGPDTWFLP